MRRAPATSSKEEWKGRGSRDRAKSRCINGLLCVMSHERSQWEAGWGHGPLPVVLQWPEDESGFRCGKGGGSTREAAAWN